MAKILSLCLTGPVDLNGAPHSHKAVRRRQTTIGKQAFFPGNSLGSRGVLQEGSGATAVDT